MPPVMIHLVAACSKTGKTTLLEKLLPELKQRGLKVAALKGHLQHYDLDLPGKDSWRFARAGADVSGLTTPEGYILTGSGKGKSGNEAAAEMLKDIDLVLVEGNKKSENPKIELVRSEINPDPLLLINTIAVVTDRKDLNIDIPIIDLDDYSTLANFIYNRFFVRKGKTNEDPGSDNNTSSGTGEELTHFDQSGRPRMVDVSMKGQTGREAYAHGEITMAPETLARIIAGSMAKGDVLGVAQVAAVMAVKETGRLIPMTHPLGVSAVEVNFEPVEKEPARIEIGVRVKLTGQTGVEMEALTGVSVAALTIYDMCKAIDKSMTIQNIYLVEKKGGRSGHYRREQN